MTKKRKNGVVAVLALSALLLLVVMCLIILINGFYPRKYVSEIEKYAEEFELDKSLVFAVIKTESGFDSSAVSRRGAKGLMQIMDSTGEWGFAELGLPLPYSSELLLDPEINIQIGCWYLAKLIAQYQNAETALAAYNAGSGNVSSWLKNPEYSFESKLHNIPFPETRNYIRKVGAYKKIYDKLL